MLIKLDEIKEVGRFSTLKHKAPQFPKLTLIYARNGYGKSTVCAVLRSAAEGKPNQISSRHRLGAKVAPTAKVTWASGIQAFNGTAWGGGPSPKVHIFDQEYVQRNLHVGDSVTRDNKRSLLPVVLGEQGVALAQRIVDLDIKQRESTAKLKAIGVDIKANHPTIGDVSSYCQVAIPADIDGRIEAAARAVELARQTVAVREKAKPKKIETIGYQAFADACLRSLTSVSEDAAEIVRVHIEEHRLGASADRWLKFGLDHHKDRCPFCNQPTEGVAVVEALTAYYSEAFGQLVAAVDAGTKSLQSIASPGEKHWRLIEEANANDFAFWSSVTELPLIPALSTEQQHAVEAGLGVLESLLKEKAGAPLAALDISVDRSIAGAFDVIEEYNRQISRCDAPIEQAKQAVAFADYAKAQTQYAKLVAFGARRTDPMLTLAADYGQVEAEAKRLAEEKAEAQRELTAYAPQTIAARQAAINALLQSFGTDFKIDDAKANFVGREPNTEYAIAIGQSKVTAGEKSESEPSFKTVLSSGDKVTLALAFFITQVRSDKDIGNSVVIFDDPFNSQDMGRQWETTSQIRAIAEIAGQVIVLSHDPRFLSMIEKDARGELATYQIQCVAKTGEGGIHSWSSAEELKALYVRRAEIIREYANHGQLLPQQNEVSVQQALRPFLEDYLRARFPARFPNELTMLGDMTDEIEAAGVADPMFPHVADLRALNEYSRGGMHGGAQVPDPTALRAQCVRVLDIVGNY